MRTRAIARLKGKRPTSGGSERPSQRERLSLLRADSFCIDGVMALAGSLMAHLQVHFGWRIHLCFLTFGLGFY